MPDALADAELTAYAAGRWPVVVRMLVLLGAPPPHAGDLAVRAVDRVLARCADEEWLDLDAVLAAETVEVWEDDRTDWWHHPGLRDDTALEGTRVPASYAVLDALAPAERARLVVEAVAGLSAEQLDDVLGPGAPSRLGAAWRADLAQVAESIPVGEARLREVRARRSGGRRRGAVVATVVAGLVAAAGALVVGRALVDPQPAPVDSGPAATSGSSSPVVPRGPDLLPVAWYDGRSVHLSDRIVVAPRLRSVARLGDGVIGVEAGGRVVLVLGVGTVEQVGATAPGARVVSDPTRAVAAWVDRDTGQLAVVRLDRGISRVALPPRTQVLAIDRDDVYVQSPSGTRRVRLDQLDSVAALPGVVDAANGVLVREFGEGFVGADGVAGSDTTISFPGRDGWLSDDGGYLLTRNVESGAAPPSVVYDLRARTAVPLPLPASSVVVDAAFATLSDLVTFVLARANGTEYPADWPRGQDYAPGFDLVVCDLSERTCQRDAQVFDTDVAPVLAR